MLWILGGILLAALSPLADPPTGGLLFASMFVVFGAYTLIRASVIKKFDPTRPPSEISYYWVPAYVNLAPEASYYCYERNCGAHRHWKKIRVW